MAAKPWIVQYREGWCALPPGAEPDPDALNDPTLCGYVVNLRGGSKRGTPDCPECLRLLENKGMTDGFAHLRDAHCNIAPRSLESFPQGVTRLTYFTKMGLTEPDAWLEVRKDGVVTDVACSEGLYAVVRDGEILGIAGPAVPIEYGYSEIPS